MQPNYAMDDAGWDNLISDVARIFDDLTLKRGFQYYKQKRVHAFQMRTDRKIMSIVEGREDYMVAVELEHLLESRCDCPVSGPCKHMAAVLMYYAELPGQTCTFDCQCQGTCGHSQDPFCPCSRSSGTARGTAEEAGGAYSRGHCAAVA